MLTKDLLNFRRRGTRLYPQFIDPGSATITAIADTFLKGYAEGCGQPLPKVRAAIEDDLGDLPPYADGFFKICDDRSKLESVPEDLLEWRWRALKLGESLRATAESSQHLVSSVSEVMEIGASQLRERLYSDLPHRLRLKAGPHDNSRMLIDRYNCGQVQGLLLSAAMVRCTIRDQRPAVQRRVLQSLKFHGLVANVMQRNSDGFEFEVSGPLSLFQHVQSYGLRLAMFFPNLTLAEKWEVQADIKLNKRGLFELKLDQRSGVTANFARGIPHIPEECTSLVQRWNDQERAWAMSLADGWILGLDGESLVPDFMLRQEGQSPVGLEIFHRWHAAQAALRLNLLAKNPEFRLIVALAKEVVKSDGVQMALSTHQSLKERVVIFREFPTCADIWRALQPWHQS